MKILYHIDILCHVIILSDKYTLSWINILRTHTTRTTHTHDTHNTRTHTDTTSIFCRKRSCHRWQDLFRGRQRAIVNSHYPSPPWQGIQSARTHWWRWLENLKAEKGLLTCLREICQQDRCTKLPPLCPSVTLCSSGQWVGPLKCPWTRKLELVHASAAPKQLSFRAQVAVSL